MKRRKFIRSEHLTSWGILCILQCVFTFNIDTDYPVLITNNYDHTESYFGASVVLLESAKDRTENSSTGWVIIGAPKAFSDHSNHTNIDKPGVVWRCSLGRKPNDSNRCETVVVDKLGNYDPWNPSYKSWDSKDDGWLGMSMHIGKSDKFVTCAPRWCNKKFTSDGHSSYLMNGICYWLPKWQLQVEQTNVSWPWTGEFSDRLMPFLRPVLVKERVVPNEKSNETLIWDMGQGGLSVHVSELNEIAIGAPGLDYYKGSVVEYVNPKQAAWYYNSITTANFPEDHVQYFGYAIVSGKFFSNIDGTIYAGGAPRAGHLSGLVHIFWLPQPQSGAKNISILQTIATRNEDELVDFLGSYFGASLAAADINGDGFEDLIVGAPIFSLPRDNGFDNEAYKSGEYTISVGEEGCAFQFISNGSNLLPGSRICGDQVPAARFSSAITSLGDINVDGMEDVAISAPYENKGAVYIYHGSPTGLKFTQKLLPSPLRNSVKGFGYSLSLGVDIDENKYPDLAVGSYLSNQVVVYRTIPVINAKGHVEFPAIELWADLVEFNISSCISYEGKSLRNTLPFNVHLRIGKSQQLAPLLKWENIKNGESVQMISQSPLDINFTGTFSKNGSCLNFTAVKLREPTHGDYETFIVHQRFGVEKNPPQDTKLISYTIKSASESSRSPVMDFSDSEGDFEDLHNKMPLASSSDGWNATSAFRISKLCHIGGNHECDANITIYVTYKTGNESIFSSYQAGSSSIVTLDVIIMNQGEVANVPLTLNASWTSRASLINASSPYIIHGSEKRFNLQRSLKRGDQEVITMRINMDELYSGEAGDKLDFTFTVTSSSPPKSFSIIHSLPLTYQYGVNFERAQTDIVDIPIDSQTLSFQHEYKVTIDGPSPLYELQLDFQVPFALNTSHGIFRFVELKSYQGHFGRTDVKCEVIAKDRQISARDMKVEERDLFTSFRWSRIFPWKLTPEEVEAQRRRVSCDAHGVLCARIICAPMKYFTVNHISSYVLKMDVLLHNLKIFGDYTSLVFETESHAIVRDVLNRSQLVENASGVFVTEFSKAVSNEVPAWAVIVGIAGGLILLIFTVLIMAKCGFFKREKHESMRKILKASTEEPFSRLR